MLIMTDSEKRKLEKITRLCGEVIEKADLLKYNELDDNTIVYQILKNLECATYEFGIYVFDRENELSSDNKYDNDFDINNLSPSEKKEITRYINKYCNGEVVGNYTFNKFRDGYKAVIPYLLNRRVVKGLYFSPKKKYVANVFKQLLKHNEHIINRLSEATVIIVSCSPHSEGVVRDNDNADSRDIINLINKYIMNTDDNGMCVNILYDTAVSTDYKTEIYILPKRSFRSLI